MDVNLRITYKDTQLSHYQLTNALRTLLKGSNAIVTAITDKEVISSGMHRPVCPKCHVELQPERNGVAVLDLADSGPHSLWDSDLWKCPECGVEVLGGFGRNPMFVHYEDTFERMVDKYRKEGKLVENQG